MLSGLCSSGTEGVTMIKKQMTEWWMWAAACLVLLLIVGASWWVTRPAVETLSINKPDEIVAEVMPIKIATEGMELENTDEVLYYPEGAPCVVLGLPLDGDDLVQRDNESVLADYGRVADYLAGEYPGKQFIVTQCNYDHEVGPTDLPMGYYNALWLSQLLDGVVIDETNFYLVSKKNRATEGEISTTFYNEPNFYEQLPVVDNHTQVAEDEARRLTKELSGRWGLHYNSRDGLHYRVDYDGASFIKLEPMEGKVIDRQEWDGVMTEN